jgi:CheY-like chemotaxis protein
MARQRHSHCPIGGMSRTRGRVVIVESSLTCAEALRRSEYHVAAFPSANTAYHAAREMDVEAFVIRLDDPRDMQPRLDLAPRLRSDPVLMHVPVILATTETATSIMTARAAALGVHIVNVAGGCEPLAALLKTVLAAGS